MAEVKPVVVDLDGFNTELNPNSDSITLNSITIRGTTGIVMVSGTVNGLPFPVTAGQAASKGYVDSLAQGLIPKGAVRVTTSGVDLTAHVGGGGTTYNASGGAGGTGSFTSAPNPINGVTLASGNRVLVKNQGGVAAHVQNGIYEVQTPPTTWDRAPNFDENDEVLAGSFVFVNEGIVHADTGWFVVTDDPINLNSTAIEWNQFTGAAQITAGDGLTKTGDTLHVGGGAGIVANADDVAVDLDTAADAQGTGTGGGSSGLEFDAAGVAGQLRAKVDPAGGIQRGASGLLLEIDDTPNTLDVDADGLKVVGLPINFLINDVVTSGTVTAANLNELTLGGVTNLHSHAGVSDAETITNLYTADNNVTVGDPVYFSSNDEVSSADADTVTAYRVIGLAESTITAGNPVSVVSYGPMPGVLTGATPGQFVWLDSGGGLKQGSPPSGNNVRRTLVGHAINATDLFVSINFLTQTSV